MNIARALNEIRDLNDLDVNTQPENPEYYRGQVELLAYLIAGDGLEIDDAFEFIEEQLGAKR